MKVMQLVVVAAATLAVACGSAQPGRPNAPQSELDSLAAKLEANQIGRIEIFQISPRVLTPVRIAPQMLETQFEYKLTIADIRGRPHQQQLVERLKSSIVTPCEDAADLRFGLVFYAPQRIVFEPQTPDMNETRAAGLYFDASGGRGAVNGTPVTFQGRLFSWLNATFSKSLQ